MEMPLYCAVCKPIDTSEIEEAMNHSHPHKSPEPDDFNAHFFKVCWPIVGSDVILAIKGFFKTGKLLKQVKNALISLVPKSDNPSTPADFRPIALTNEQYHSYLVRSRAL